MTMVRMLLVIADISQQHSKPVQDFIQFSGPTFVTLGGTRWHRCGAVAFMWAPSWVPGGRHAEEKSLRVRFL